MVLTLQFITHILMLVQVDSCRLVQHGLHTESGFDIAYDVAAVKGLNLRA